METGPARRSNAVTHSNVFLLIALLFLQLSRSAIQLQVRSEDQGTNPDLLFYKLRHLNILTILPFLGFPLLSVFSLVPFSVLPPLFCPCACSSLKLSELVRQGAPKAKHRSHFWQQNSPSNFTYSVTCIWIVRFLIR